MRSRNFIIVLGLTALIVSSCAKPIYQCGQLRPEKFKASKRIMAVVDERDHLCSTLELREQEIAGLKGNVSNLNDEVAGLKVTLSNTQKKYDALADASLTQAQQLNMSLQQKSEELALKEKILQDRERALAELQQVVARQDSVTNRLNDVLRNALLGFRSDELSVEIMNGKVYVSMSDKLLFKSGSASIEAKGKDAIRLLADVLNKNQDIDILIEGHTDNVPIRTAVYKDNWDLSVARATSIVRILTDDHNIAPIRVTASGKGEFAPRATNDSPEGRAANRRTEIILSPKLEEIMQLLKTNPAI